MVGKASLKRIGLIAFRDLAYSRQVQRGIYRYAHASSHAPWGLIRAEFDRDGALFGVAGRPDGVIGHIPLIPEAEQLIAQGIPVVTTSGHQISPNVPRVSVDDVAVGRMAAEYFLGRSFRHFAFVRCGLPDFGVLREQGFVRTLIQHGANCEILERAVNLGDGNPDAAKLAQRLHELPKPLAVFTLNDETAAHLSELCLLAGIHIPGEVALLGVDDDDLYCNMTLPPTSSVRLPAEQIGYEAGRLLDHLMSGQAAPDGPILLPPTRVVTRQSSDVHAIGDREVATVMAFIQAHADQPIGVRDVLTCVPLSRRMLEQRFRAAVGRSLYEEILRAHLELAKRLLMETDLRIPEVARCAGFHSQRSMGEAMLAATGLTASAFRQRYRLG